MHVYLSLISIIPDVFYVSFIINFARLLLAVISLFINFSPLCHF